MLSLLEDTFRVAVGIFLALAGTGVGVFSGLVMLSGVVGTFAYGPIHILTFIFGFLGLMVAVALWRAAIVVWEYYA